MGQVFVCHSSSDKILANQVCRDLESEGLLCWIAPRDVTPGAQWAAELAGAIDNCGVFLLIFTTNSNGSDQVLREVERAVRRRKVILNYRSDNIPCSSALDYYLAVRQWFDPAGSVDEDMKRLAVHLRRACAAAPGQNTASFAASAAAGAAARPAPAPLPPRANAAVASVRITIPAPGFATLPGLRTFYKSMSWLPYLNSMASLSIDGVVLQKMSAVLPATVERNIPLGDHTLELKLRMQAPRIYQIPLSHPGQYDVKVGRSSWTGNYAKQCRVAWNESAPITVLGKSRFSIVRAIMWCLAAMWFLGFLLSVLRVS